MIRQMDFRKLKLRELLSVSKMKAINRSLFEEYTLKSQMEKCDHWEFRHSLTNLYRKL